MGYWYTATSLIWSLDVFVEDSCSKLIAMLVGKWWFTRDGLGYPVASGSPNIRGRCLRGPEWCIQLWCGSAEARCSHPCRLRGRLDQKGTVFECFLEDPEDSVATMRRFGQAVDARLWRWLAPLQYSDLGLQNWLSVSHCSLIIPRISSPLFPNYFSVISQWCSYYSLMISQLCAHYFPTITQVFPQLFPDYHFLLYIIVFSWFPPNASHTKLRVLSPRKSSEVGLCDQTLVAGYVAEKTSLHFFEVREGKGSDWRFLRGNSNWHPLKKSVSAVFLWITFLLE